MKFIYISIRKEYFIYKLDPNWIFDISLKNGLFFDIFSKKLIDKFFYRDIYRKKLFNKFLSTGHIGYLLHNNDNWINYTWVSPPKANINFHLPKKIKNNDKYWIFFCRTNEFFQGRGFYSLSLKLLCNSLIHEHSISKSKIYIDTESNLIPATRAIERAGFIFHKKIFLTSFRIPKLFNIKIIHEN